MKLKEFQIKFKGQLYEIMYDYMKRDDCLLKFYEYLLSVFFDRLLWDRETMRRYNDWFYLNINKTIEDTKQDDQEIINYFEQLKDLSLVKVKDSTFNGVILMKIDFEMIRAIYKINIEENALEEEAYY